MSLDCRYGRKEDLWSLSLGSVFTEGQKMGRNKD